MAVTLLIFQLFTMNLGLIAESKTEQKGPIDVTFVEQHDGVIKWEIDATDMPQDDTKAMTIMFGVGQTHGDISVNTATVIESGYVIDDFSTDHAGVVEIATTITNPEQTAFELTVEVDQGEVLLTAAAEAVIEQQDPPVEQEEPSSESETEEEPSEEGSDDTTTDEEETTERDDQTNDEQGTEDGANSEDDQASAIEMPAFTATKTPKALPGVMSGSNWPDPGSLKLDKQAAETADYGEWEVELTLEGKNLKTSSDIVIVFDRSGSMAGSKLQKAKTAAKQFVDNLLIPDSTTRIALVPFNRTHGTVTDFKGYQNKSTLKNAIDGITATGGTNIQAGIHQADALLNGSTADQKTIVLLSDGSPTYSFKAGSATSHSWPGNKYDFLLSNFDYGNELGNGSDYDYPTGFLGFFDERYTVDGFRVTTNGIPTLSEAHHIMNAGIGMYSIGLGVGNNSDASYVLENSQNKGYYEGGEDDLTPIFEDIAAALNYPATNAVVTDPLGDMFNLVADGGYGGTNYDVSHGSVSWDAASETFTWDIGDIKEGDVYSLKYKVVIDCFKDPEGQVMYPTNKTTPLNYTDFNGDAATRQFPIPEVGLDTGKITKKGYRVNVDGDPIDSNGDVVSSPDQAEQLYTELYGDDLSFNETYDVTANVVPDFTLTVGDNPTPVELTSGNACVAVWFGYARTDELVAGDVTATYVDEDGNVIADEDVYSGQIGDSYTTEQKQIPGYEFKEMDPNSAPASGTFQLEEQTVIYVYTKKLGSVTIQKVDENGDALQGAEFVLSDGNGNDVATAISDETGTIVFDELEWGTYTIRETKAPDGYRLLLEEITVEITPEALHISKEVENTLQEWEIPKTGGIGTLGFYSVGILIMAAAIWFAIRRRKA